MRGPFVSSCPSAVAAKVRVSAAVGLFVAHYNLARVHETIRMTPAMFLGVTDHIWTIGELIEAATTDEAPEPEGRRVGQLWVIDGGLA